MQVRQVARVASVHRRAQFYAGHCGRIVDATVSFEQQLALCLALEELLQRLLRVDAAQLLIILKNIAGNPCSNSLLYRLFVGLRCHGRSVPLVLIGSRPLLLVSNLGLVRHLRRIRTVGSYRQQIVSKSITLAAHGTYCMKRRSSHQRQLAFGRPGLLHPRHSCSTRQRSSPSSPYLA